MEIAEFSQLSPDTSCLPPILFYPSFRSTLLKRVPLRSLKDPQARVQPAETPTMEGPPGNPLGAVTSLQTGLAARRANRTFQVGSRTELSFKMLRKACLYSPPKAQRRYPLSLSPARLLDQRWQHTEIRHIASNPSWIGQREFEILCATCPLTSNIQSKRRN